MSAFARIVTVLVAMLSSAAGVHAQGTTFVSANGTASTGCTIAAPCRTLHQGVSAVQAGGTVVVLDSGEFGTVNDITKSVTIDATGVAATISAVGVTGMTVNGSDIVVTLRNLEINAPLSTLGIWFLTGATLIAEDVRIRNVTAPDGAGIRFSSPNGTLILRNVSITNSGSGTAAAAIIVDPSAGAQRSLSVENSFISRNSRGVYAQGGGNFQMTLSDSTISYSTGNGIEIAPTAGNTKVTIKDSKVLNNGGNGLMLYPTGSAKINTTVVSSAFDGNVIGIRSFPASPAVSNLTISDTSMSNNAGGIHASGKSTVGIIRGSIGGNSSYGIGAVSPAAVRIGSSVVNGNTLGFSGPVSSYGNNQLLGNTTQGSSTPVAPAGRP